MGGDVLPPVDSSGPLGSGPDAEPGVAAVGEGLEVPLLRLEHVPDAVGAHGHHHLRAGLRTRGVRDTFTFCWQRRRNGRTPPAHLVEPADGAQAARGRLGRVQTAGLSRVVVVDPRCLGDAVQQSLVRYGGAEGQILAHHLEKRITIQKKKGLRA